MTRAVLVAEAHGSSDRVVGLLKSLGCEVDTTTAEAAATQVRASRPALAVLDVAGPSPRLRTLIERVRLAAESRLPVLLLLPEGAWWLRAPPAAELGPLAVLASRDVTVERLTTALGRLGVRGVGQSAQVHPLAFDASRRALQGSEGSVRLTPSEAAILRELLASPDELVSYEVLCDAVWGQRPHDEHERASLRSHIHTLRGKLARAGERDVLVTERAGYRLTVSG